MLKKYKNQLFTTIQNLGIDFNNFKISATNSTENDLERTTLTFIDTPFDFVIRTNRDSFDLFDYQATEFRPGYPISSLSPGYIPFSKILEHFTTWLNKDLRDYLDENASIDLWTEYTEGNKLLNIDQIDFNDKAQFSYDERKQISFAVEDLKFLIISQFQLKGVETKLIHQRLDYLTEAAERMNKFDWKSLVISTIIGIATTLSLDTEQGKDLFLLFKRVFGLIPQLMLSTPVTQ